MNKKQNRIKLIGLVILLTLLSWGGTGTSVKLTIGNSSVAATEPQVAGEISGNEFYKYCDQPPFTEEDVLYDTFCFGYVLGVIEAKMYNACPPDNLAFEQALDLVRAWVRNNPVQRHLNAAVLIRSALESAYACE